MGINLLKHAFKLCKIILDKMQYGFLPGRVTVVAVFVLRRLTEKFITKSKKLFFVFVDLGKAFDQVPGEVICFALS